MIYNIDLEQKIIGAIMVADGSAVVHEALDFLQTEDFFAMQHKEVIGTFYALKAQNKPLNRDNMMLEVPSEHYAYVAEQWRMTSSSLSLIDWCHDLRKYRQLRETQERIQEINEVLFSSFSVPEKLEQIEGMFSADLGFHYGADGAKHAGDCVAKYLDELERRWTNPESVVFSTGIAGLDEILGGGYEAGLHAIAARPKVGKTELMVKMVNHFSGRGAVYVGSLEMSDMQMMHRLVSQHTSLDKTAIYKNFPESMDFELDQDMLFTGIANIGKKDIYIDDRYDLSVNKIWRECRKLQKKHGSLSGVFVDYLTLMKSETKFERRDLEVGHMTISLKAMSKEFNCPVVMLLQLNRGLESRQDKRPMPSDSRDSGAIEQDVDSFIGLYRDSVYNESSHWKMITEIILRLNRHGGTGTAYQLLTGSGFKDVSVEEVARLVHQEETSNKGRNPYSETSNF